MEAVEVKLEVFAPSHLRCPPPSTSPIGLVAPEFAEADGRGPGVRASGEVSLERILDSTQAREAPLNSGLVSYQTVIYRLVYQTYRLTVLTVWYITER